ncbi:unnamed protein product, partial [Dibothriocephalus latus]
MLGDIGRIPIITLSACKSLSEILSDLPLPQPTPNVPPDSARLLNDPLVRESAEANLQSCKEWLVDILAAALDNTSTNSMNDASAVGASKKRSQKQTSQPGIYSVVSVEPLKLSIKRAANHSQELTSDAGKTKQRRRRRAPGKDTKSPKRTSAAAVAAAAAANATTNSHPTAVPA